MDITHDSASRGIGVSLSLLILALLGCATPREELSGAIQRGDTAAVKSLLEAKFTPSDATDRLRSVASAGYIRSVRIFLDAGVNQNSGNETALMAAASAGQLEVVRLLLERGADIDRQQDALAIGGGAAGGGAGTSNGETVVLKLTTLQRSGHSALSLAIVNRHPAVVRLLLEKGASIDLAIVHKEPEFAILNTLAESGRYLALRGNFQLNAKVGSIPVFFRNVSGTVTTNSRFETEKIARLRDLAETSGNNEIRSLFKERTPTLLNSNTGQADSNRPMIRQAGSATQSADEEALYQNWTREKSTGVFQQYFQKFPQGKHRDAIVDEVCKQWGFLRVDGASVLVRFKGLKIHSKAMMHDGKSYVGGFPPKPKILEVSAKPGRAFVTLAIEFLALGKVVISKNDVLLQDRTTSTERLVPFSFHPIGMGDAVPVATLSMDIQKMSQVVLSASWESGSKNAEKPIVSIFQTQFDLSSVSVERF